MTTHIFGRMMGAGVTPPIALGPGSVLQLNIVVLYGSVNMGLEWSNDLQNWKVAQTWGSLSAGLNPLPAVSGLAMGYVRVSIDADIPPIMVAKITADAFAIENGGGSQAPPVGPIA